MSVCDKNDTRSPGRLTLSVGAEKDEEVFMYLNVSDDEDGREYADLLLHEPSDVDEFEREVMEACAQFRALHTQSDEPAPTSTKKSTG